MVDNSFFHMDQYGIYVWATYAITLTVFVFNIALVFWEKKSIRKLFKFLARAAH